MKLLKSVLFAAAVNAQMNAGDTDLMCQTCPDGGKCGSGNPLWLRCDPDRNICVCEANWVVQDGKPGCAGFESNANKEMATQCRDNQDPDPTEKPDPIENEARLCGKCNDKMGCGTDADYMFCHKAGFCVCDPRWGPNDDMTSCTNKLDAPMEFDLNMCKDINPDVVDEVCPADMCGDNEVCKGKMINGKWHWKCVCADGFEYDEKSGDCLAANEGKCTKNTQCDIDNFERCDKTGTGRCVCRDGFMRDSDMMCIATCGKYQTLDMPMDYDARGIARPREMDNDMKKYLMKYQKPQICDPNATCAEKDYHGLMFEACVCNAGFLGNGCECWNQPKCQDYCDKKKPGSMCIPFDNGDDFACVCDLMTQTSMNYPNGDPCCVTRPVCATHDDCIDQMGDGGYCKMMGESGQCICKEPLKMNKKGMCAEKGDEDDYESGDDDDDVVVTDPCHGVKCARNAHCKVTLKKEAKCVCNDGFEGTLGENCIKPGSDCTYGSCHGSHDMRMTMTVDYNVYTADTCGKEDRNLMCMDDGCCGCRKGTHDKDGDVKNGCEVRDSPCAGKTLCSKHADCIDLETEKPDPNEYDSDCKGDKCDYDATGGKGRMCEGRMDMMCDEPTEIPLTDLGYKCRCRAPLVGTGIGPQGCLKPEEERINECKSLRNPCGRNSVCEDWPEGYGCTCEPGFVSPTRDGHNCIKKKPDPIKPVDNPCDGFCWYTKAMPQCHLRDLPLHGKLTDFSNMGGDAGFNSFPMVTMKLATRLKGWPLNRVAYTAFLEFDQAKCGNVLLGAMMSGDVKVAIYDKAGANGESMYRIDGVQGYLTKTKDNSRAWSGLVVQFTKKAATLGALTGDPTQFEENQFIKTLKDGSLQMKPDYDTFHLTLMGKEVSPEAMGAAKYAQCFNIRKAKDDTTWKAPFDFVLWDERTEAIPAIDTVEHREKLIPLNGDFTKCYLKSRIQDKGIKDIICDEPLIVNGEKQQDNPTFLDMINSGDKDTLACTEKKD